MNMKIKSFTIYLIVTAISGGAVARIALKAQSKIPSYLKVCHRKDPKLNECVKESIEKLRPKLVSGIKELLLPSCEPLEIPQVAIKQNAGAISMESVYSNVMVHGLTNFTLQGVRVDPETNKFRIKFWFPHLKLFGNYKMDGKLLLMPLHGNGTCNGSFGDVDATASIKAERVMLKTGEHLKVKDLFVEFNIGTAEIHLNDLFDGNSELGEAMNSFLNDNWKTVAAEIRPAIEDSIGNIVRGITEKLFDEYALEQLLPE
ncbi:Protein takeout [Pseudolycoriella hygida]|uniref:Protein takeout n=1 Tax=Pseudolycoriella hygida TaxID=35572 RepID=A0A9Q0MNS0_9DIPT|nr:Protein takeout [Pseudolycoriella hygida]